MRAEVKAILAKLQAVKEKVDEYLDTAENADYPNDDRIDKLQNESDCLDNAIASLEEIE